MMPLYTVFGVMVFLFALIGSLRGWAKELIVSFSVILALFLIYVLSYMVPIAKDWIARMPDDVRFYVNTLVVVLVTVFGYAGPAIVNKIGNKVGARQTLQDAMLGFFLGLINGVLIIGSLWYYLDYAHYGVPPEQVITAPQLNPDGSAALDADGLPIVVVVGYQPDAEGLADIRPPAANSPSASIVRYMPPALAMQRPAYLFLAVALAFVFVLVVFI